jgi:uncharacterized protein
MSPRLPAEGLRPALGTILLASGLALLSKSGTTIAPAANVGVPLAVAVLAYLVSRTRTRTAALARLAAEQPS